MLSATRSLAIVAAVAGVLLAVVATKARERPQEPAPGVPLAISDGAHSRPETAIPTPQTPDLVSYAFDVGELDGLPPNVTSGQKLDLWVTWEPPVTKRTVVQPLMKGIALEKVAPPVLPNGPAAALFLVPQARVGDLIWADRYGALSVVLQRS